MLRITTITGVDTRPTLKLEGKLLESRVGAVLDACMASAGSSGPCQLDLSGITFADAAGAALLRSLIRRGLAIVACSSFSTNY